jgi:hypothetical protein
VEKLVAAVIGYVEIGIAVVIIGDRTCQNAERQLRRR